MGSTLLSPSNASLEKMVALPGEVGEQRGTPLCADTSKAPRTASFPLYPEERAEHPCAVAEPQAEGTCGTLTANCCLPLLSYPGLSLQYGAVVAPPPDGRDEVVGLPLCLAAWPAPAPVLPPTSPQLNYQISISSLPCESALDREGCGHCPCCCHQRAPAPSGGQLSKRYFYLHLIKPVLYKYILIN